MAPNSCHRPSPQGLIDLLHRYQGGIDGTKLPVHAEFQLLRHTRRAIASERGGPVVSSTSKSASALSRVEGVATGCSGSEKESEGSRRLTTSAAPSPSEWLGKATTTWAVQASLAMFRERLCDDHEELLRATCDEVRAHFLVRVLQVPLMEGRAETPPVECWPQPMHCSAWLQTATPSNSPWRNEWLPTEQRC